MLIRQNNICWVILKSWIRHGWNIDFERKSWIYKKIFKAYVKTRERFICIVNIEIVGNFIDNFICKIFKTSDRVFWWTKRLKLSLRYRKSRNNLFWLTYSNNLLIFVFCYHCNHQHNCLVVIVLFVPYATLIEFQNLSIFLICF